MDVLLLIMRYLHLLGFAAVFGGWLAAYLSKRYNINAAMLLGIATQLATGFVLFGISDTSHMKMGIKLLLALLLAVMIVVPWWKKRDTVNTGHFIAIGAMTLVTVGVATFMPS